MDSPFSSVSTCKSATLVAISQAKNPRKRRRFVLRYVIIVWCVPLPMWRMPSISIYQQRMDSVFELLVCQRGYWNDIIHSVSQCFQSISDSWFASCHSGKLSGIEKTVAWRTQRLWFMRAPLLGGAALCQFMYNYCSMRKSSIWMDYWAHTSEISGASGDASQIQPWQWRIMQSVLGVKSIETVTRYTDGWEWSQTLLWYYLN